MKQILPYALVVFLLVACTASSSKKGSGAASPLPNLGVAPELTNDVWLNVNAPLRLSDLRGKVVAIDMWTFG